jgi:hypothetical protein
MSYFWETQSNEASDFQFSQANLRITSTAHVDFSCVILNYPGPPCRHSLFLKLNAAEQGMLFHRMIHQSLIGVPHEEIAMPKRMS